MKFLSLIYILFLSFCLCLIACEEENDDSDVIMGGTAKVSVKINGKTYNYTVGNVINEGGTLNIGSIAENALIQISPPMGTFTKDGSGKVQMNFGIEGDTTLAAFIGNGEILEINLLKAIGTFEAKARDVLDILQTGPIYTFTEGTFDAELHRK